MRFADFCKPFGTQGEEVELARLLQAREQRAALQQQLLQTYQQPVLSLTLLAMGGVKKNALLDFIFAKSLEKLTACFTELGIHPTAQHIRPLITGHEALFSLPIAADKLKKAMIRLETQSPLARLWDLDVFDAQGNLLSRTAFGESPRPCLLCEQPAKDCARARRHSLADLIAEMQRRATAEPFSATIADWAYQALLQEAYLTPKAGLVDRANNGSHKDMNLASFERSAAALRPFFAEFVQCGIQSATQNLASFLPQLRAIGLRAEQAMHQATGGVNTHKGAIFSFGLVCGAVGRLWRMQPQLPQSQWANAIFDCVSQLCQGITAELQHYPENQPLTAGVRLFRQFGVTGARGEAEQGFPRVQQVLPLLDKTSPQQADWQRQLHRVLLSLMAQNADTNLLHRGGMAGLTFVQQQATWLLSQQDQPDFFAKLTEFDTACMARNLSAGGSADLLALTIFFHFLRGNHNGFI